VCECSAQCGSRPAALEHVTHADIPAFLPADFCRATAGRSGVLTVIASHNRACKKM